MLDLLLSYLQFLFGGCTKPELGFRSYLNPSSYEIRSEYTRPCSKHGKNCRVLTDGCVKTIKPEIIYKKVKEDVANDVIQLKEVA